MEGLEFDNILGQDEVEDLFAEDEEIQDVPPVTEGTKEEELETTTEDLDVENLFTEDSESVGSEEKIIEEGENTKLNDDSTPNNFYSSIANAMKVDGVLPDLDDEKIGAITDDESFAQMLNEAIATRLDEKQQRIDSALNAGVEPTEIKKYENALEYLDGLDEETLSKEDEASEKIRQQLIYQDYINRGFSQARATKAVQRALDSGTDVEDAIEALRGNKSYFKSEYDALIEDAKLEEAELERTRKLEGEALKKSILEDKDFLGGLAIDETTRNKVYNNINKPAYKDPETGELLTAVQKYQKENKSEYLKNVGVLFTLTDGFKNIDNLVKGKVKKEVKKGLKELEHTLNNTARHSNGSLNFSRGIKEEASKHKGWTIDI